MVKKTMKIIIVGCGKVGVTIAEQLCKENNDVVVIDTNEEKVRNISNALDIMGVVGSGSSHSVQMEAGIAEADLMIAVTGADELNLLCCLIAKKAGNGCQGIARVRNPEYNQELRFIQEELGLAMVINSEMAAAMEMARILRFPSAIKVETFAQGHVELLQFRIAENSILDNLRISDMGTTIRCNVLVCAVVRGEEVLIPDGNFVFQQRDVVSIVATPKVASQFFKRIRVQTDQVKNAMIVGGSKTTYYLATQLLAMGIQVKIIDKDRKTCEHLSDILPKATIICGDGTNYDLLMEEGISRADSFLALTGMDEENVLLSLFVRDKYKKAKVITKVNNTTFDQVINKMDLDSIIYPKYVTAEHILRFVRAMKNSIGSNVETLYRLVENRMEALEFVIRKDSAVLNTPLQNLHLKKNLLIACIYRNGVSITPNGQDMILLGDTVIVVTTNTGLNDIDDILGVQRG
jgi:trk system potassium uptake protein TrkA